MIGWRTLRDMNYRELSELVEDNRTIRWPGRFSCGRIDRITATMIASGWGPFLRLEVKWLALHPNVESYHESEWSQFEVDLSTGMDVVFQWLEDNT